MIKLASTLSLVAALGMSPSACETQPTKSEIRQVISKACPTLRTLSKADRLAIAEALEKSPQSYGLDILAEDWLRMREAIATCRSGSQN